MVEEYSMIAYESKEMEGYNFEPYMQATVAMTVAMSWMQLPYLFDMFLSSLVRRDNDPWNDSSHICQKLWDYPKDNPLQYVSSDTEGKLFLQIPHDFP